MDFPSPKFIFTESCAVKMSEPDPRHVKTPALGTLTRVAPPTVLMPGGG